MTLLGTAVRTREWQWDCQDFASNILENIGRLKVIQKYTQNFGCTTLSILPDPMRT